MKRLVLGALAVLGACGPAGRGEETVDAAGSGSGSGSADGAISQPSDSRVFAHSGNRLYRIDTTSLVPVDLGAMNGLGTQSLTDLAIDKNDRMFGVTLDKLYTINAQTGAATPRYTPTGDLCVATEQTS